MWVGGVLGGGTQQSDAAPPTWAPEASPGETRGEVLCCTKSGRLALPGKPLLAAELRRRSLCFWRERERGGLLRSEAVIDRSGDGGQRQNAAVCRYVCFRDLEERRAGTDCKVFEQSKHVTMCEFHIHAHTHTHGAGHDTSGTAHMKGGRRLTSRIIRVLSWELFPYESSWASL